MTMAINKAELADSSAAVFVIVSLMRDPLLLESENYILAQNDFHQPLQQIIFTAIYNIAKTGAQSITPQDIDLYLKSYPSQYDYYQQRKGYDWLLNTYQATEKSDPHQFTFYYERLKKFSVLRDLVANGFDIGDFYDLSQDFLNRDIQDEKLNNISLAEMINKVREKLVDIENRHVGRQEATSQIANEGLRELVENLKNNPEVGLPFDGEILNYAVRGARLGKLYIYSAPSGQGKAIPNNTIIPTAFNGFKRVDEIKTGDFLLDRQGKPTQVLGVFPQGEQDLYQVTFADGRVAYCNNQHLWTYQYGDPRYGNLQTSTLQEIITKIKSDGYKKGGRYAFQVPLNHAVEYSEKAYSIDPYVLGLLLGDGVLTFSQNNKTLYFSSQDDELPNAIGKIMNWSVYKTNSNNYSYYFKDSSGKNIHVDKLLGEYPDLVGAHSYNKFIPNEYLFGSVEQRLSLLQGLLDTDGCINDKKGKVSFCSVSKQLVDNIKSLIYSLGYKASVTIDKRSEKYTTGILYNLSISAYGPEKIKFFRLRRKLNRVEDYLRRVKRFNHIEYNAIVDIQEIDGKTPMTCFLVDNDEHLFLMNDYIVTHNTRFMVGNACAVSLPYIENNQIVVRDGLQKVLFVATEMTADEIQTLILAYVSGINEEKILLGSYSEVEERQLKLALEILDKYGNNFIIESMPDPSRAEIRAKLAKYILQEGVEYIFYDYIFSSPGLLGEFRDLEVREDVALMMLSNTLKEIAMTYSVFILSATQLNGNWEKNTVRNANLIRGSKAIVDKVDIGIIGVKLTDEERKEIQEIIDTRLDLPQPNVVMDLYKNRRGKLTGVKIFRYFDYGTCRTQDLYITDSSYRPYITEDGKTRIVRYAVSTYDKLSEIPEEVADNGIPNS